MFSHAIIIHIVLQGSITSENITGHTTSWIARSVAQLVPAGICPYDKVVCLVVDECHKATGKYDIVTAVKKMQAAGCKFRVLGLSATPGNTVDAIQVSCPGDAASRRKTAAQVPIMVHARMQELMTC